MKKLVITLLVLLYVIPTFGINVTIHYCGGEISLISFGTATTDKCACGNKKMKKNCCQNKNYSFQIDDNQIKTPASEITFTSSLNLQIPLLHTFEFEYNHHFLVFNTNSFLHPPNKVKPPLYILHQVFRI